VRRPEWALAQEAKRPFSSPTRAFFETPLNLFFSRRIVDPGADAGSPVKSADGFSGLRQPTIPRPARSSPKRADIRVQLG